MAVNEDLLRQLEEQDQPGNALRQSLYKASHRNPDKEAEVLSLSERRQLPRGTVDRNLDEVKRREKVDAINIDDLLTKYPKTATWLEDEDNAAVGLDDVDVLKGLEKHARPWYSFDWDKTFTNFGEVLREGVAQAGRKMLLSGADVAEFGKFVPSGAMPIGMEAQASEIEEQIKEDIGTPTEEVFEVQREKLVQELLQNIRAGEQRIGELTPEDLSIIERGVRGGGESLIINSPGLLASMITRSPAPALSMMGTYTGVQSYGSARAEGRKPGTALAYGGLDAAIEVATELIPTTKLIDIVGDMGAGRTLKGAIEFVASELGGEQLATLGQSLNAYAFDLDEQLNNAGSIGEMAAIQAERQAVTFFAALAGSGPQAAVASGVGAIQDRRRKKVEEAVRNTFESSIDQERLDALISLSQSSATNNRDSARFQAFMDSAAADEVVYVPEEDIASAVAEGAKLPDSVLNQMTGAGVDISIPLRDFLSTPDLTETLRDKVRARADGFNREELNSEGNNRIEEVIKRAQESAEIKQEADQIFDQVAEQLIATGRMRPEEARYSAQLIPAYATVKAQQLGIPVQDVFREMGLDIIGPEAPATEGGIRVEEAQAEPFVSPQQDFSGVQITEQRTVEETGEKVTIRQDAQKLWERAQKRRNVADQLRGCLNGG